ncbi:hypothetical protein ACMFMG_007948 [Clarireedia jacksonii]
MNLTLSSNSRKKDVYVELPKPTGNAEGGFDIIPNPLYFFTFPADADRKEAGQKVGRGVLRIKSGESNVRTVRVPSKDAPDATNDGLLNLAIQCQAGANAILFIQMLNSDHTAAPFSSGSRAPKVFVNEVRSCSAFANHSGRGKTTIEGKTYPTVSVESFHDGIHNLLGTGGGSYDEDPQNNHKLGGKSNQGFASNVERLLCLHQAIYPDKYLDDGAPSNNLAPFLHENCGGAFWKSIDKWIKNYWNSGFAVPGAMQPQGDFKDMKAELTKYLVETYLWAANNTPHNLKNWLRNLSGSWTLFGSSAAPVSTSAVQSGHAHLVHREVAFAAFNKQEVSTPIVHDSAVKSVEVLGLSDKINESLPASALEDLSEEKRPTYQITWNTYVKIRKHTFDGSFNVHLFVGYVKDNQPEQYITKKNEAGFTGVFCSPQNDLSGCSNCVQ